MEQYERFEPISYRNWKNKETKTIEFLDDGRDVNTPNGASVVFAVREANQVTLKSLWIKPGSAIHIGVNEFIPLKGKTLKIGKAIDKDKDIVKGTRYGAVLVK